MKTQRKSPRIQLYTARFCAACEQARRLLARHGLAFEEVDLDGPEDCCRLHELTGGASVPQAIVDGRPVGGYAELAALVRGLPETGAGGITGS